MISGARKRWNQCNSRFRWWSTLNPLNWWFPGDVTVGTVGVVVAGSGGRRNRWSGGLWKTWEPDPLVRWIERVIDSQSDVAVELGSRCCLISINHFTNNHMQPHTSATITSSNCNRHHLHFKAKPYARITKTTSY